VEAERIAALRAEEASLVAQLAAMGVDTGTMVFADPVSFGGSDRSVGLRNLHG
jgi:hypothetical protein